MSTAITGPRLRRFMLLLVGVSAFFAIGATAASAADDVGLVDQKTGIWYLRDAGTGETTSFYYGNPNDVPFVGDWNCDGVQTPGLYRQSDGFVYLRNSNTQGTADVQFYFGNPGDVPIAGDFNNDGCDTVSIYRPSETTVYIVNAIGADGGGLGAADFSYKLGIPGDVPVVGDPDNDGTDTVSMFRASNDTVYVNNEFDATGSPVAVPANTIPLLGEWPATDPIATFGTNEGIFSIPGTGDIEYGSPKMVAIGGAFGALPGGDDPPPVPPPYPDIGDGKRIIYSNSQQHVWLIDENNRLVDDYPVSGRVGIPYVGTYSVFSKSVNAWAPYGGITMKHMVRFVRPGTWGNRWSYGFHSIPRYPNGQPMQTVDELGYYRSGGCVRQEDGKAAALFEWADIGTTVHAIP